MDFEAGYPDPVVGSGSGWISDIRRKSSFQNPYPDIWGSRYQIYGPVPH